jgi:hypothetical protein
VSLRIWQPDANASAGTISPSEPQGEPRTSLQFGRHDPLRKTVYARVEGDRTILALPETILDVLPKNTLAFRERQVLALNPGQVNKLTIVRGGIRYVLEPSGAAGRPNAWRMREPVSAPADVESVTAVLTMLNGLRAESLVAEKLGDGKAYGLDQPAIRVSWWSRSEPESTPTDASAKGESGARGGTLAIAGQGPTAASRFAVVEGHPPVFTLSTAAIQPFLAEFHDRRVLTFPVEKVERLTLRWPDRTLSFARHPQPLGGPADWRPEPGIDVSGFDMSRLNALAEALARLSTTRFVQYGGVFPIRVGLAHPRLVVQVELGDRMGERELRIGDSGDDGLPYATTTRGDSGPVFALPGLGWTDLLKPPSSANPPLQLPSDVFMPTAPKSP